MLYTKKSFFKEILILVIVIHCMLLGLLFVFDKGDFEQEKFMINSHKFESTVVFMPLQKRVIQENAKNLNVQTDKAHKIISYDAYTKLQKTKQEKKVSRSPKKAEQKIKKSSLPPKKEQKIIKSPIAQKTVSATLPVTEPLVQKPATVLKVEKSKKIEEKKIEKIVPKKAAVVEKVKVVDEEKIEKLPSVAHQEVKNKVTTTPRVESVEPVVDVTSENNDDQHVDIDADLELDLEKVSFVGRYDLEKYELEEALKKEILKHWKSPIGISKTAKCELSILVSHDGKAQRVLIIKGSGSLAYDMSGRAAAYQSRFPKEVCGKEFIIELGS